MKPTYIYIYITLIYYCGTVVSPLSLFQKIWFEFSWIRTGAAGVVPPQLMSHFQLPSPPLTHAGIDVWVLRGARWIICAQKVLWAGRQFRDKSNKMVKSTASWTIYLSGSRDIVFRSGCPARQSPQRSGLYWNFDSVFQSCHFLKSVCNKGDGLLRRSRGREGGKYKKVLLERGKKRGSEINQRLVIRRRRTHKSWQWSITLIWAAAERLLQAD